EWTGSAVCSICLCGFFFFQAEGGIGYFHVTGFQTCALPLWSGAARTEREARARAERAQAARRRAAQVAAAVAESGAELSAELEQVVAAGAARRDDLVRRRTECATTVDQIKERVRALSTQLGQLTDAVHRDEVAKAQAAL